MQTGTGLTLDKIRNKIAVDVENGCMPVLEDNRILYSYNAYDKELKITPLELAQKLQAYGFIDAYSEEAGVIKVRSTHGTWPLRNYLREFEFWEWQELLANVEYDLQKTK